MGVYGVMNAFVSETQCVKNKSTNLIVDDKIVECGAAADTDNANDGREEGEIVDDFELILSSEGEEFSVRQRIRELEAENKELEEITKIGRGDENEYNYYPGYNSRNRLENKHFEADVHVLSDLSSISSGEFQTPKKKKRHKGKKSKSKHGEQDSRREHSNSRHRGKRREHHHRSDRKRRREGSLWRQEKSGDAKLETILVDSNESCTDEVARYENDSEGGDEFLSNKIHRERLRFALAHDTKREVVMGSLKERLRTKDLQPLDQVITQDVMQESQQEVISQEAISQEKCITIESDSGDSNADDEYELRLIALKSAMLNKHQQRQKRNAEMAYSPTDFIDDVQLKNMHDSDIDDIMEISPAESPVRDVSPFEEASVDTKPIDMELATSDDSDCEDAADNSKRLANQWISFNVPNPMNSVNQILRFGQYLDLSSFMQLQNIMGDDTSPPPPSSFHIAEAHFDENNSSNSYYLINRGRRHSCTDIQSISMDNTQDTQDIGSVAKFNESSDEEEKALRALLLSKCKAKKPADEISPVQGEAEEEELPHNEVQFSEAEPIPKSSVEVEIEDAEELRSLLLNNMKMKRKTTSEPAPSILKEAVRRFQLKSQCETETCAPAEHDVMCQEATPADSQSKATRFSVDESTSREEEENDEQSNNSNEKSNEQIDDQSIASKVTEVSEPDPVGANDDVKCLTSQPEQSNENSQASVKSSTLENESEQTPALGVLNNHATNDVPIVARKPSLIFNGLDVSAARTQSIKIVKPNKVINNNAVVKRKALLVNGSPLPSKKSKLTPIVELSSTAVVHAKDVQPPLNGGRLLTKADLPGLKANKLIITLGSVESDSDDDLPENTLKSHELQFESIALSYSDNASPISLPMESPCGTPTRSNTPSIEQLPESTASSATNLRKTVVNDVLEKKIDDFLKHARSKVPAVLNDAPSAQTNETQTQQVSPKRIANQKSALSTPVAVRHLPASSQAEYRRLVERMQMLEKRKALRVKTSSSIEHKEEASPPTATTNAKPSTTASPSDLPSKSSFSTSKIPTQTKLTSSPTSNGSTSLKTQKAPLAVSKAASGLKSPAKACKLLKEPSPQTKSSALSTTTNKLSSSNEREDQTPSGGPTVQSTVGCSATPPSTASTTTTTKPAVGTEAETIVAKLDKLESSYCKIGDAMHTHLNKSLAMVEEAKFAKIARIRLGQRLEALLAEVSEVEHKMDVEMAKMTKIVPKLRQSQNLFSQLKKRRKEIYSDAVELGKGLGDTVEYRFKDDDKVEITRKTTSLAKQISFVNSLCTINDLKRLGSQTADHVTEAQAQIAAGPSFPLTITTPPHATSRVTLDVDKQQQQQHLDKMSATLTDNCDKNCDDDDEVQVPKSDAPDTPDTRDNDKSVAVTIEDTQHEPSCVIDGASRAHEQQPKAISEPAADRLPCTPPCGPDATAAKSSPARRRALIFEELEKKTDYAEPCYQTLEAAEPKALQRDIYEDYHSPLASLRSAESHVDPQSLVCPYDLMGNCQDNDCPFLHLSSLPSSCDQRSVATAATNAK